MVNNYISITINGKQVGLKFGFAQVKEFAMALGANLNVYFDGDNISPIGIAKLIHAAHRNDCLLKEVDPAITFEQISDWIDGAAGDEKKKETITKVVKVWQESEYTKSWLDNVKKKTAEVLKELEKTSKKNTNKLKVPSARRAIARKK